MQFDFNMLRSLISLPDKELWQTICFIAGQNGISIPPTTPPPNELARLRSALSSTEAPNVQEAIQIVNEYKKQNGI